MEKKKKKKEEKKLSSKISIIYEKKNNCKIIKCEKNISGSKDEKWFLKNKKK